jgi:hypothetical protein
MLVGISEAICLLSTFLKYSFQNVLSICKEFRNEEKVDTKINNDKINLLKKDRDERFDE